MHGAYHINAFICNQLVYANEDGVGTPISLENAVRFYTKAAEQGNSKAQQALARLLAANQKVKPVKQSF